ncbi:MAG TPA: ABC-F family ATP-binding cassette domain-containing protein [Candidatus Binataceae bacterium]|nr:ABC-F family ATP-binding cassette domain-containing protein [Candidatus Binataceae bacterium]
MGVSDATAHAAGIILPEFAPLLASRNLDVLTLDNLSKSFGGRVIFDGVSWSMTDDARVSLVGLNGAGKSTLLRMIAGRIEPDSGRISRPQRSRVGYLEQDVSEMGGRCVLDETLSGLAEVGDLDRRRIELEETLARETSGPAHQAALDEYGDVLHELERHDFYSADSRATAVLFGLGFKDADLVRDVAEFSGGVKMRIALAKLLLQRPDFLMLDEPTNHLDIEARNWLEDYLQEYAGGIILVSHDHYFLDRVTNHTVEVARGRLADYAGNYSYYLEERQRRFEADLAAYEKQRTEIEHMEAFISRFRYQASKAKLVQSRIKQLDKIERLEPPPGLEKSPAIAFPGCERSARRVLALSNAVKRYGELSVYDGISLEIERGARIALVGPNGAGKSTMIRLLAGIDDLTAGKRIVGDRVQIGYFAQNLAESLDYGRTVFDEVSRDAQAMTTTEIRNLLGAMLFSGDDANKRVGVLSGGERARLALAKVIAKRNNCLLLDEPTNNLDIVAKETLLEALRRFPGTVVIVSHDRHILNQLVTEVIEVGHGHTVRYLGNYDEYLDKKMSEEALAASSTAAVSDPVVRAAAAPSDTAQAVSVNGRAIAHPDGYADADHSRDGATAARDPRRDPTLQADRDAQRNRVRAAKQREALETEIEKKETERAGLATEMNDPNFYLARKDANEMIARYDRLGHEIDRLYEDLVNFDQSTGEVR